LIKHFKEFTREWNVDGVVSNDMSLMKIRQRNNDRKYPTVEAFLDDIDQLVTNVRGSANLDVIKAREFMNEACHLQDQALALVCQLPREVVNRCTQRAMEAEQNEQIKAKQNQPGKEAGKGKEPEKLDMDVDASPIRPKVVEKPDEIKLELSEPAEKSAECSSKPEKTEAKTDDTEMSETFTATTASTATTTPTAAAAVVEPSAAKVEEERKKRKVTGIEPTKMEEILSKLTEKTMGYNVDELEDIYFRMLNTVYHHSASWDRLEMMDELERQVNSIPKPIA